jgi:HPt (histidine-containing phosphotransfer) domain-containing protein
MKGDADRCLAAGMDAYLAKPLEMTQLRGVLASLGKGRLPSGKAPKTPKPEAGLLDAAQLLDRVGGDRRALDRLVRLFLTDSRVLLAHVREAADRGQAPELRRAAHALKGSVANFGAPAAVAAAARLQQMGESGDLSEASAACASLEQELARVREGLQAIVARGRARKRSGPASTRKRAPSRKRRPR